MCTNLVETHWQELHLLETPWQERFYHKSWYSVPIWILKSTVIKSIQLLQTMFSDLYIALWPMSSCRYELDVIQKGKKEFSILLYLIARLGASCWARLWSWFVGRHPSAMDGYGVAPWKRVEEKYLVQYSSLDMKAKSWTALPWVNFDVMGHVEKVYIEVYIMNE